MFELHAMILFPNTNGEKVAEVLAELVQTYGEKCIDMFRMCEDGREILRIIIMYC